MAHEIDTSKGRAAIAYVGQKPWHGLGAEMLPGMTIEEWRKAAGLDFVVKEAIVKYQNGDLREWPARKVLYRDDTGAPLSIMADGFNVVQPADILNLYEKISKAAGFTLETAGALSGGKRVWALAKVSDGFSVSGDDQVKPYVLLATSFDGSMATTGKFLATRVVCNNTMQVGLGEGTREVKVVHSVKWSDQVAERVRKDLGIVRDEFERFMLDAQRLRERPMGDKEADAFAAVLMQPYAPAPKEDGKPRDPRDTKGYKRILELFKGKSMGYDMAGETRWGMLNAVTQMIDHERGRSDATRLDSAWFGVGNAIKVRAFEILEAEYTVVDETPQAAE